MIAWVYRLSRGEQHAHCTLSTLDLLLQYFDTISSEINELLQEAGQLTIVDLALQYNLSTELLIGVINSHLGSVIKVSGVTPGGVPRVRLTTRDTQAAPVSGGCTGSCTGTVYC